MKIDPIVVYSAHTTTGGFSIMIIYSYLVLSCLIEMCCKCIHLGKWQCAPRISLLICLIQFMLCSIGDRIFVLFVEWAILSGWIKAFVANLPDWQPPDMLEISRANWYVFQWKLAYRSLLVSFKEPKRFLRATIEKSSLTLLWLIKPSSSFVNHESHPAKCPQVKNGRGSRDWPRLFDDSMDDIRVTRDNSQFQYRDLKRTCLPLPPVHQRHNCT